MNYNNTTKFGTPGGDTSKGRRMLRYTAGRGISEQEEDMGFVSPKASEQEKVASFGPLIEEKNKIWQ